jgi:hypothetical protein
MGNTSTRSKSGFHTSLKKRSAKGATATDPCTKRRRRTSIVDESVIDFELEEMPEFRVHRTHKKKKTSSFESGLDWIADNDNDFGKHTWKVVTSDAHPHFHPKFSRCDRSQTFFQHCDSVSDNELPSIPSVPL